MPRKNWKEVSDRLRADPERRQRIEDMEKELEASREPRSVPPVRKTPLDTIRERNRALAANNGPQTTTDVSPRSALARLATLIEDARVMDEAYSDIGNAVIAMTRDQWRAIHYLNYLIKEMNHG